MYCHHFGFQRPPFRITPDPELFFPGGNRGAVLDALIYAISRGEVQYVDDRKVEDKIHKRSAGRFFGRPSLADRIWIGLLALLILTLGLGLYWLMRSSETGSLKLREGREAPQLAPGAREALPRP